VHGRKETLKSRYKAEDLLVGSLTVESEPPGARIFVGDKEYGTTPLRIDKIREGTYVVRFAMKGYEDWELPASVETGRETRVRAPLGVKPGSLEVITEPVSLVSLGEGPNEETPHIFTGLAPGEYVLSFDPRVLAGRRFHDTAGEHRIEVKPGEKAVYRASFPVGTARFRIGPAISGETLLIDGRRADMAAARGPGLRVESGEYDIETTTSTGQGWYSTQSFPPGFDRILDSRAMWTAVLVRRTIKLDGKKDSWEGIEPLSLSDSGAFLGDPTYGLKALYMCRDGEYLYWRVDFREKNPLVSVPPSAKDAVKSVLIIQLDSGTQVALSLRWGRDNRAVTAAWDFRDLMRNTGSSIGTASPANFKVSEDMYVARIPLSLLQKYLGSPRATYAAIADVQGPNWASSATLIPVQIDYQRGAPP